MRVCAVQGCDGGDEEGESYQTQRRFFHGRRRKLDGYANQYYVTEDSDEAGRCQYISTEDADEVR